MALIIVTGVPGSGKSTVLKTVGEMFPSIKIVGYGEEMAKELAHQGIDRDQLRKMPVERQVAVRKAVALKIVQDTAAIKILDSHACIRTEAGYTPGFPMDILSLLKPKAFVGVECPVELIVERRIHDSSRRRDEEDVRELALHQALTRQYLVAYSAITGGNLCIVENGPGDLFDNVEPLVKLIRSFSSV
jgi:adenylate kinase